jgi:hypothetical protein
MILGPNTVKESNSIVQPVRHPWLLLIQAIDRCETVYPTIVIKVGHMQTLSDLYQKVVLYFDPQTTIQIVLVVKLNESYRNNTIVIITTLYLHTSSISLILVNIRSFGTAPPSHSYKNYVYNIMNILPHLFTSVKR